ncbi:MAG: hypothetical protein J6S75_10665 [Thermoguttaceae bacterium]|nr:hypothetical protein [Thermoguttaceae bacterium]
MRLPWTKAQFLLELLCLAMLLGMITRVVNIWDTLPGYFPIVDQAGQIVRKEPKNILLTYPMIAATVGITLGLVLCVPPAKWNMPCRVKEENANGVYSFTRTMLLIIQAELFAGFTLMQAAALRFQPAPKAAAGLLAAVIAVTIALMIAGIYRLNRR